jgi:hypothetical protein
MPLNRPEAITSKYIVQYTCSALATAFTVPMVDAIGVGLQCTLSTILVCVAGGLCVMVAFHGVDMQNWVDRRWPAAALVRKEVELAYDGPALEHVRSAP